MILSPVASTVSKYPDHVAVSLSNSSMSCALLSFLVEGKVRSRIPVNVRPWWRDGSVIRASASECRHVRQPSRAPQMQMPRVLRGRRWQVQSHKLIADAPKGRTVTIRAAHARAEVPKSACDHPIHPISGLRWSPIPGSVCRRLQVQLERCRGLHIFPSCSTLIGFIHLSPPQTGHSRRGSATIWRRAQRSCHGTLEGL